MFRQRTLASLRRGVPCERYGVGPTIAALLGPYIGALLFGGVLLALSLFAGGHDDAAGDAHGHGDGHGDGHGEGDLEADGGEAHADGGHDSHGAQVAHEHGGAIDGFLSTFASLRFWTFFFAFGGATGLALTILGLPTVVTAIAAGVMGGVAGGFAAWAFRYIAKNSLSSSLSSEDWIGRTAKVTVPVSPVRPGKILITFDNEVKELLALSAGESDGAIGVGEEVLIVSMTDGVAKVTLNRLDQPSANPKIAARTVKS